VNNFSFGSPFRHAELACPDASVVEVSRKDAKPAKKNLELLILITYSLSLINKYLKHKINIFIYAM
jgi:hypothetical protein